nr:MAG TPA: hypothetical protein [Caudoviricetes sp.]
MIILYLYRFSIAKGVGNSNHTNQIVCPFFNTKLMV